MSNPETLQKQDGFKSKWGFIMACIGSAVGMANIWRFPWMVSTYGGMTFLLPYFLFVILIGSTGVMEEFALGRWAAAGPVGAFGKCTKERSGSSAAGSAIGALPIIGAIYVAEVLSDIIQVAYFKLTHGKRIFRMAPLHHHFEMGGWSEVKLFGVFSGITVLLCLLAFWGVLDKVGV